MRGPVRPIFVCAPRIYPNKMNITACEHHKGTRARAAVFFICAQSCLTCVYGWSDTLTKYKGETLSLTSNALSEGRHKEFAKSITTHQVHIIIKVCTVELVIMTIKRMFMLMGEFKNQSQSCRKRGEPPNQIGPFNVTRDAGTLGSR